jgi:hypothetical protein
VRAAGFGSSVLPEAADAYFRLEHVALNGEATLDPGFAVLVLLNGEIDLDDGPTPRSRAGNTQRASRGRRFERGVRRVRRTRTSRSPQPSLGTESRDAPYVRIEDAEDALIRHYASLLRPDGFAARVRDVLTAMLADEERSVRLVHDQLTKRLKELDVKEDNLLDLVDGGGEIAAKVGS